MPKKTALLVVAVLAIMAGVFIASSGASAQPTTQTKNLTFTGSDTQNIINFKLHCDACVPDFILGSVSQLVFALTVDTEAELNGAASLTLELPEGAVNQGSTIPVPMTLNPTTGNLVIKGIVAGNVSIQDNVPCNPSPWLPSDPSQCQGTVACGICQFNLLDETFNLLNQPQTPLHNGQESTLNDSLKSPTLVDPCELSGILFVGIDLGDPIGQIGAGVKCPVTLKFSTTANLTGNGITADRSAEIKVDPPITIAASTIDFPKGQFTDKFVIPCDAPASSFIKLTLGNKLYGVNVDASGKVDLQITLQAGVDLGPLGFFDIIALLGIDATAGINLNDLLGLEAFKVFQGKIIAPAAEEKEPVDLGQVSKDKEQPIVTSAGLVGEATKGQNATFEAAATDNCASGEDLHFKWQFDDGGVGFGPRVEHAFKAPGFHTGTVSVTDIAGLVDERDFFFVVGLNGNTNIKYDGPVGLSANETGPIELGAVLIDWQGNGVKGEQLQFSIVDAGGNPLPGYPKLGTTDANGRARVSIVPPETPGEYIVVVHFKGDDTHDEATFATSFDVHDNRLPDVSPLADPGKHVWGVPVEFSGFATDPDGGAQDSLKYAWDFGDGTGAINNKVSHAYTKPGTYSVSLTVTDKDGGSTTVSRQVRINKRDTHIANCGPVQVVQSANRVDVCLRLVDSEKDQVIGRTLRYEFFNAPPFSRAASGFTDATGTYQAALNIATPSGCYKVETSFDGTADNLYNSSTYNFIFYSTAAAANQQACTLTVPAPAVADFDINCDGSTDAVDALYVLQVVAGLIPFTSCAHVANVNGDGVIDAVDALYLLQLEAGLIESP